MPKGTPQTERRPPVAKRPPPDDGHAFLPDPRDSGQARTRDEIAETLAEEFVTSATSAEETAPDLRDEFTVEEVGGPFVEATGAEEFADTEDEGESEPFPTAIRAPKTGSPR
jgi:hypothetical protein